MSRVFDVGRWSDDFADREVARVNEVLGGAGEVEDAGVLGIDSGAVIERGEDFLEGYGASLWSFAVAIGGADDLSGFHAAASENGGIGLRPVIAAVIGVDSGSAAEFSPDDDGDIAIEPAFVEVGDEGRESLIEPWAFFAAFGEVHAIWTVPVPAAEVKGDEAGAGFDESACDAEILDHGRCAIALEFFAALAVACKDFGIFL